ncbi:hypothetical protein D779_3574 [Imhoffiella purpurea]|uniref:Uncharacterized protein n=1 Tax=Imhoffiella purpurea TaxID=1249627 RepID=W9V9L1_9GAMM|nr:hypothetical protein D779_3574 [Imhoffiella purpurea]
MKFNAYEGKESKPAYEIRLSKSRLADLQQYKLECKYAELNSSPT